MPRDFAMAVTCGKIPGHFLRLYLAKQVGPCPFELSVTHFKSSVEVYRLENASTTLPSLSSAILQLLFSDLKDPSLAFLVGVWTSSDRELGVMKPISLFYAAAFLEAHVLEDDEMDFETILTSIFVALHDAEGKLSQAAFE